MRLRRRDGSWGGGFLRTFAVMALVVVAVLPMIPVVTPVANGDSPTICACGCGKIEGECCCSATRVSRLEFGCSNRDDPNDPLDGTGTGKIIGPPEKPGLVLPNPAAADLEEPAYAFAGLDPRPEIPPPRT